MRALVFDRTCVRSGGGLSPIWWAGAQLYRGLGRIDAARGFAGWDAALDWLAGLPEPIDELQFWGHGQWGRAMIDRDVLDASALRPIDPRRRRLDALRERLAPGALVWFRTCQTLGARAGIDLAERLADLLGARIAGHTYVIHFHQSGLHGVAPGGRADWSPEEGLAEGTADAPGRARRSAPWAPRTITCLDGEVPAPWFAP